MDNRLVLLTVLALLGLSACGASSGETRGGAQEPEPAAAPAAAGGEAAEEESVTMEGDAETSAFDIEE
ncbi:MAG: hypothetical protein AB8I08_26660 [Sandaracinaceae bacterium]